MNLLRCLQHEVDPLPIEAIFCSLQHGAQVCVQKPWIDFRKAPRRLQETIYNQSVKKHRIAIDFIDSFYNFDVFFSFFLIL